MTTSIILSLLPLHVYVCFAVIFEEPLIETNKKDIWNEEGISYCRRYHATAGLWFIIRTNGTIFNFFEQDCSGTGQVGLSHTIYDKVNPPIKVFFLLSALYNKRLILS